MLQDLLRAEGVLEAELARDLHFGQSPKGALAMSLPFGSDAPQGAAQYATMWPDGRLEFME